ncbi:unnamed protein product, partial [Rotaria sp. Silwood1]
MELPYNQVAQIYQLWLQQQLEKWKKSHEEIDTMIRNTYVMNKYQLRTILYELKDTIVGQVYQLSRLLELSSKDDDRLVSMFSANVPVTNYDTIKSYVDRMIDGAETNLLVKSDAVALYVETSGTTSTPKRFPIHKRSLIDSDLGSYDQRYIAYQQFPQLFELQ